jgi:glycosyltransferase involved in cell wall biosynthesis
MKYKVAYIHGRPSAHPMHQKFAQSVGAEFHPVDFKMRWQDRKRPVLYRLASWIVCAIRFPKRSQYDIFLVDNLHFMPVVMKLLGLLKKRQKIVVHMGSHTLYFMYAHRFSPLNEWLHKKALARYDAVICEGAMAAELTKKLLGHKTPPLYTVINGIPEKHFTQATRPALAGGQILFMGHGPGENRLWYKGLDLMLDAFAEARRQKPGLTFTVVGDWDADVRIRLLSRYDESTQKAIRFTGASSDLDTLSKTHALYLHCARGEAFGLTILIAMANGLPALVSEWTGAREVVEQVSGELVAPLDVHTLAGKICWYFDLPLQVREDLSAKCRAVAGHYTEAHAVAVHRQRFEEMLTDFYGNT